MNTYSFALFLHIVGVLMLFATLAIEWVSLRQIHGAKRSKQVHAWLGVLKGASKTGFPSMLVTVVTGIYMMTLWGWTPWLVTTVGGLFVMIVFARVTTPRVKAVGQSMGEVDDPLLWISVQTRLIIVLGILYLKIAKPEWIGSLLIIGAAVILGIASALMMFRSQDRSQALPTDQLDI